MNIELSKKQFKFLLELVHLGNWVVNSNRDPDVIDENYEEIENVIYSYAKEAGLKKYVEYSENSQTWVGSDYLFMNSDAARLAQEYNEHNFWEDLIDNLALKDFHNKYSEEKIQKMSTQKRFEKFYKIADLYRDEINNHGIDRLEIVKRIPEEK